MDKARTSNPIGHNHPKSSCLVTFATCLNFMFTEEQKPNKCRLLIVFIRQFQNVGKELTPCNPFSMIIYLIHILALADRNTQGWRQRGGGRKGAEAVPREALASFREMI